MTRPPDPTRAALVRLVRDEGRRVLATLVRLTGDLQLAEDAVQDATVRALESWSSTGVPAEPRGWLTLTARRRAIDLIRREAVRTGKETAAMFLLDQDDPPETPQTLRDDQLRLMFVCCHPSLSLETQVALALRTLCGLSTSEVGLALLVPETTIAKRLTRARQKIRMAAIPYRVPEDHELPDRLAGVAAVVYLLFNEGYSASAGDDPLRPALVVEATRLARLLSELMPGEPAALGLLALVLLQDSRRDTRHDQDRRPVLLADQDRGRWRRSLIEEGVILVGHALRRCPERPDPYVIQAAIAACHALAPTWEETDWDAVVSWYDVLLAVHDTPVVRLNRAVAVGELRGPAAGLTELDRIPGLADYPLWHAARAELLLRVHRAADARTAFVSALQLPQNSAQQAHLERRLATIPTC